MSEWGRVRSSSQILVTAHCTRFGDVDYEFMEFGFPSTIYGFIEYAAVQYLVLISDWLGLGLLLVSG